MKNPFEEDLQGIKGWLVLVAIGVVISPFRLAIGILPVYIPIFRDGIWRVLITPGSDAYHPLWAPLLALEISYNIGMFIGLICLIALLFTKSHLFPILYIVIAAIPLFFLPLDSWLISRIMPENPIFDEETIRALFTSVIACAIWIPYMLKSERVKATFIRGKKPDPIATIEE